jgi:ABC-type antimicrobial peptide transport system permease subunit
MSYRAVRRRSEIGIRLSLGATRASVVRLVLTECIVLVALGLAIGAAASSAAVRGASSLLFGLSAHDVPTQAAAVLLLAATAGIASWLPAWRASRLDPTIALRHE